MPRRKSEEPIHHAEERAPVFEKADPDSSGKPPRVASPIRLLPEVRTISLGDLEIIAAVSRFGSPGKAAEELHRQHSSVLKQFSGVNSKFELVCGEQLAKKRERGESYLFSSTGEVITDLAEEILHTWMEKVETQRRIVGRRLTVATTTFTLGVLSSVWAEVMDRVPRSAVDLQVHQIRTKDFDLALHSRKVDLVIGGRAVDAGRSPESDDFEFLEWGRVKPQLLTNLRDEDFPHPTISKDELKKWNLILPSGGIIVDLVRKWYGPSFRDQLRTTPPAEDVYYGVTVLELGIERGFLIALEGAADIARRATAGIRESVPPNRRAKIRTVEFGDGFKPLEVVTGLFGRKGDRERYETEAPQHPLALFWKVFESQRRKAAVHP